ncbi:amidase [Deinococcus sonorensis]|uniref:Amidase n=2 Tax=Deinococcus sonorensis TaxID=309891 RepID=A0AAU7U508_9DEIO
MDIEEQTAEDLQAAVRRHERSCEELTSRYLERIERFNPRYNAVVLLNPRALSDARALDARLAAGEPPGPLAGLPLVIKDSVDVAGLPTTAGWAPLSKAAGGHALRPEQDAPVVARLRAAGAVILGKTNVPAFSYDLTRTDSSWAGPTLNAVCPALAPGASSAGTATAVSGNLAFAGLAEETAGSIQNPAAAQQLVGIKPTFGLVPTEGAVPLSASARDVIGPHARTVRDAALLLGVMAGQSLQAGAYLAGLRRGALQGRRLGLYGPGWRDQAPSAETQRLYARALDDLRALGGVLIEDPFAGSGFAAAVRALPGSLGFECLPHDLDRYLRRHPHGPAPSLAALRRLGGRDPFAAGEVLGDLRHRLAAALAAPEALPDLRRFHAARADLRGRVDRVLDTHTLDALVFPQRLGDLPPLHGPDDIQATTVSEINVAGLPGVTVPAGQHASGAPFALIFVGRAWSEARLLALAHDYEQATRHRAAPRLLPP